MLQGEDYDRIKLLHITANEAERLDRKKKKKNPDIGFADYEQATARWGIASGNHSSWYEVLNSVMSWKPNFSQNVCSHRKEKGIYIFLQKKKILLKH